jgi:hypothetical protein
VRTQAGEEQMFEFDTLTWKWSYGDSNPRPLACHTTSPCIWAGPEGRWWHFTCDDFRSKGLGGSRSVQKMADRLADSGEPWIPA